MDERQDAGGLARVRPAPASSGPRRPLSDVLDAHEARPALHERGVIHAADGGLHRALAAAVADDEDRHRVTRLLGAAFLYHLLHADAVLAERARDLAEDAGIIPHVEAQVVARLQIVEGQGSPLDGLD